MLKRIPGQTPFLAIPGWVSMSRFDLMHIPGLLGMPRRIYTYEPGRGWDTLKLFS